VRRAGHTASCRSIRQPPHLVAFETHLPKGYMYFAMAFSLAAETINILLRNSPAPKMLRRKSP